ncbi:RagB/SusD family nutrient uptake outer membrane protein [Sphingobacterium bovistauri]|uniref:RagB/SusD family nutrient uptake outer membrane protein n=1 Tax=Sphingobacterium bovistauri TaxID=2781959 RepID=A0ABS7Z9K0_9SPHI|nr:RagB/SusD family nutrient uptake outer membrane protein [Sphingobacterium bovistauri]MCA5006237.1 RagB/SusD family nutrient uptake outer membrane protein [Sphingobacterium bovistauri]
MKKIIEKYKIIILLIVVSCTACNKWVDIPPKDRLTQNVLFATKEGYLKALNGIYSELATSSLYGRELSMGTLDVMAQYYNMGDDQHNMLPYSSFDYSSDNFKTRLNTIWSSFYKMIANANAILDRTVDHKGVLVGEYYGMVRGESLAIRAMLHFDLLRMYGPIYSLNKDLPSIPYIASSDRSVQPLLSSEKIIELIVKDLVEAEGLLREADPVTKEGPRNFSGFDHNDFHYRQYRLNYFAVKALLARAHLWAGNKVKALESAKAVIDEGQRPGVEFFPFVTLEEFRPSSTNFVSDRVFSKEVLFSCYSEGRVNTFNSSFSASLGVNSILTFPGSISEGRSFDLYDNQNDYRRGWWSSATVNQSEVLFFNKYEDLFDQNGNSNAFRYMIPLIRISEMYLIAAECNESVSQASSYLNKLRLHRGIHEIEYQNEDDIRRSVESEYIKEFMGEGQLFYFFKRNAYTELPDSKRGGTIPMALNNYIFPLPESETSQRN